MAMQWFKGSIRVTWMPYLRQDLDPALEVRNYKYVKR